MKTTKRLVRKGFTLVELLVVIAIIAALAGASYGPIMKQVKKAARNNQLTNGKNLHTAAFSYASDNGGRYPSKASLIENMNQLMITGDVDSEEYFWNKENASAGIGSVTPPDNDGVVDQGEVSWTYVSGLFNTSKTDLPLFMDAYDGNSFLKAVWDGYAIVVRLDASSTAERLDLEDANATDGDILVNANGQEDTSLITYVQDSFPETDNENTTGVQNPQ